jgi:hypothetical protein
MALVVAACGSRGDAGAGTEVIEFDLASIPINENQPVYDATCQGSEVVPRPGAFKCTFENGGVGDPCFVIKDNTLICGPNPVHASYQAVVTATEPLPEVRRARGTWVRTSRRAKDAPRPLRWTAIR